MRALAKGGSISHVAKELKTTPANIRSYGRKIEKHAGIPIYNRATMRTFLESYRPEAFPPGVTAKQLSRLIRYASGETYEQIAEAEASKPSTIEQALCQTSGLIGVRNFEGEKRRDAIGNWLLANGHVAPVTEDDPAFR